MKNISILKLTTLILKILLLQLFFFSYVQAANDKAFFWQVSSANSASKIYLLGSIHFADESFYPLRPKIQKAFEQVDALVVELNVNAIDGGEYNRLLTSKGIYKEGNTIKQAVSEETWLQLRQQLEVLGVDYDAVKNYKPGMLVLTLSALQVMQMGFKPELGIDVYFLSQAMQKKSLKKIIALETLEQQLNLFLNVPNGALLLKESLHSLDEAIEQMEAMVTYWKTGDEGKMNKLLFDDALKDYPAFGAIYDRLFYQRNAQMTKKIQTMLAKKGVYFVVVGSGHLVGEQGIVNTLKEKGYVVERL